MSEYGFSLLDLFRGDAAGGVLWVLNLITQLPTSGRFYAEKRGGIQYRDWDPQTYATAAMVTAIRALQYTYILSKTDPKKRSRVPVPEPYPIPETSIRSQRKKTKPGSFRSVVTAAFSAARKKRRGQADG